MTQLDKITDNGILMNSKKFSIKIAGLIADAPATAKVLNMNQYNGYFGCFKCLIDIKRVNNRMIYEFSKNIEIRSNSTYLKQVDIAINTGNTYQGVKGSTHLSNYLNIPDHILFDFMHCSCIGTCEQLLNLWLFERYDENRDPNVWYLGIKL